MPKASEKSVKPKTKKAVAAKAKVKKAVPVKAVEAKAVPVVIEKSKAPEKLRNYFYANGKRKTSMATVRLYVDGQGTITINNRSFENYFTVFTDRDKVLSPLRMAGALKTFDLSVMVSGGGVHSQAEAVRHAISKALLEHDAALRSILKPAGFLTRDSRIKERKKYGLKKARRAPQWQKR